MFDYPFLKYFCFEKKKENIKNTICFHFFCYEKHGELQKKSENKNKCSKNTKIVFYVFSKIVLENSFQKWKANIS